MNLDANSLQRGLVASGFSANYARTVSVIREREQRARTGKVVIRPGRDRQPGRPSSWGEPNLHYLGYEFEDTAAQDWRVFVQEVHKGSVGHVHQGGLALFVLEGSGATIMNGVRHDWEAGDLVMLPITPGGVDHRHLSFKGRAKWIAFWYDPVMVAIGSTMVPHIPDQTPLGKRRVPPSTSCRGRQRKTQVAISKTNHQGTPK